jgi:CIC family chloride channel protein
MVLEVSGSYSIIVPVIVANTVAYVISRGLQPTAIFDVLTRQDGLDLPSMEEQREEGILRVEDAMQPMKDPVLDAEETIDRVLQQSDQATSKVLLIRLNPTGWSTITKEELQRMASEGKGGVTLSSLLNAHPTPYLHPDHSLDTALRYVDRWPLVPVVSRADYRKLEGVVSQHDVLSRYRDFGEG